MGLTEQEKRAQKAEQKKKDKLQRDIAQFFEKGHAEILNSIQTLQNKTEPFMTKQVEINDKVRAFIVQNGTTTQLVEKLAKQIDQTDHKESDEQPSQNQIK